MFRWAAQALDNWIIRQASARMPRADSTEPRLEEAAALLRQTDFFGGPAKAPDDFTFIGRTEFKFGSPLPSRWPEDNVVFGRLFRAGTRWEEKPCVVLLHGWNGERQYRWQFPPLARRLSRQAINAAMIELPYHCRRKPRQPGAPRNFITQDVAQTVTAARQALADAQALLVWLASQGSPALGIWGFSLGAWLGGLLACYDPRVRFAALLTPVPRMDLAIEQLSFCEPLRCALRGGRLRLERLNLLAHPLNLPSNQLLLIKSEHDTFVPPPTIEELWRAWGRPEIWRLPHGHISVLLAWPVMARTVQWLTRKAQTPEETAV